MGSSQRTKGHNFERTVARQFRELYPEARRGLDQTQAGTEPDVTGTPFWIECKVGKRPPTPEMVLNQAYTAMYAANKNGEYFSPIAVVKRDGYGPVVIMDFSAFLRLLSTQGTP